MKIKTADLIGPAIDWAVGTALELPVEICQIFQYGRPNGKHYISIGETDKDGAEVDFEPSEEWSQGGPIIEEAGIGTSKHFADWSQQWHWCGKLGGLIHHGPTPLIAAMRALVASKLGDEIDIPDELV